MMYYAPIHSPWIKTREEWLKLIIDGRFPKVQPPRWWLEAKEKEGRSIEASAAIWHRHYKPERKYVIWDQAPDEDFRERGYLV